VNHSAGDDDGFGKVRRAHAPGARPAQQGTTAWGCCRRKKRAPGAPFLHGMTRDQPFSARAARRLRLDLGSSVPVAALADEPLVPLVVLEPVPVVVAPVPAAAPVVVLPAVAPRLPIAPPLSGAPGFTAPCSPAAVPGPWRPALSESAGDPDAAYAPATPADMHPAINANMSFLISDLPIKDITPPVLHDVFMAAGQQR
jgi:hypothetical protein